MPQAAETTQNDSNEEVKQETPEQTPVKSAAGVGRNPNAVPRLPVGRYKEQEFVRTIWIVTAEEGTTRKHLSHPDFWANPAQRMKAYDRIEVRCDDNSFFAEYLVVDVGRGFAVVKELLFVALEAVEEQPESDEYEVKQKGPHIKWCVIRKSDGEKLVQGLSKKSEANTWLSNYLKTIDGR